MARPPAGSYRPGLILCLILGLGLLAPSSAPAALQHLFLGNFGSATQPAFTEAEGLAVDQSTGDLLVIDAGDRGVGEGTISRWHPDGTPANFSALGTNVIDGHIGAADQTPQGGLQFVFPEESHVAVDDSGGLNEGHIYVPQDREAQVVDVFAQDGAYLGQLTGSSEGAFNSPCGVAVGASGEVFVGDYGVSAGRIHRYDPVAAAPLNLTNSANLPFSESCALAAGSGPTDGFIFPARLLVGQPTGPVAKLDSSSGAEQYEVDPGKTITVSVDPATGHVFVASAGEVREYDASGDTEAIPLTPIAPSGAAEVHGVAVDGTTGNLYLSRAGSPMIEVWGPAVAFPEAETQEATATGATVTLHGTIDPDDGPPAACAFEYVEVHAKGFEGATSAPCSPPGLFSGSDPEAVSAELTGLPEAAYRFRLKASNANGSDLGEALFFTTFLDPGLPDGRAYEMVSPPQKLGEVVPPEPAGFLGGSCGDCLPGGNFPSMPMQSAPDGNSVLYLGQPFFAGLAAEPSDYLAVRSADGWETEGLSSAATTGQYQAFSDDLSRGVLFQVEPPLSAQAPTRGGKAFRNLYLQEGGAIQPLLTEEPPNRNPREPGGFQIRFAAANAGTSDEPAFGHLLFEANDALTAAVPDIAPSAPDVGAGTGGECTRPGVDCNLYEWVGGALRLVNVLPGNEDAAGGSVFGSGRLLSGLKSPDVDHAISAGGSRIFWSSEETGHVYVRADGEVTFEIPGPGTCRESEPLQNRACFLTAALDGSKVLLSDGRIYELNEAGHYEAAADLTLDEGEVHQGGFEGILGAAEDLSRVYFVDTAALTAADEENENANGEHAEAGKFNLYRWDEGQLTFIGVLSPKDRELNSLYGGWTPSPSHRLSQASPDGTFLAFTSVATLTGYDNGLRGGAGCVKEPSSCLREVFEYSAQAESLTCVSCNPGGRQPLGHSNLSLIRPASQSSGPPFRQPANLSPAGDGRLFFESQDALLARDTNGKIQDVYEWEPQGVGGCKRAAGCVYLISSGQSPNDSIFLDSSAEGDDAFFITRERLLARDKDELLDLYDARIGGGFDERQPEICLGDACKGASTQPGLLQSPGSAVFEADEPPPPPRCRRGFVRRHNRCVAKHRRRKKHHKHHHKPAKHNRGGRR